MKSRARGSLFKRSTISPEVVERHQSENFYGDSPTEGCSIIKELLLCLSSVPDPRDEGGKGQRSHVGGSLEKRSPR